MESDGGCAGVDADGPAAKRARSTAANEDGTLDFYSAWFCPYAQRAWISLNYVGAPYRKIESLQVDPATQAYVKNEGLLAINPKGLVPTLQTKDGEVVTESIDVAAWVGRTFGAGPSFCNPELLEQAAQANAKICSPYYRILMRKEAEERKAAWASYQDGLQWFASTLGDGSEAAFFNGALKPTIVDVAIFPWMHRRFILEHFRGLRLEEPPAGEAEAPSWVAKVLAWQERMEELECVKATLQDREAMFRIYERYADGTAKSLVGDAVRAGKEAHEHV